MSATRLTLRYHLAEHIKKENGLKEPNIIKKKKNRIKIVLKNFKQALYLHHQANSVQARRLRSNPIQEEGKSKSARNKAWRARSENREWEEEPVGLLCCFHCVGIIYTIVICEWANKISEGREDEKIPTKRSRFERSQYRAFFYVGRWDLFLVLVERKTGLKVTTDLTSRNRPYHGSLHFGAQSRKKKSQGGGRGEDVFLCCAFYTSIPPRSPTCPILC